MSTLAMVPQKLRDGFNAATNQARDRLTDLEQRGRRVLAFGSQLKAVWSNTTGRLRRVLDLPSRDALASLSQRVEKLAKKIESFEKKAEERVTKRVAQKKANGTVPGKPTK